jgi:hypothetical protein
MHMPSARREAHFGSNRSAMIVRDLSWFHVFLVPDEGFGAIIPPHVGSLAGHTDRGLASAGSRWR